MQNMVAAFTLAERAASICVMNEPPPTNAGKIKIVVPLDVMAAAA
jgi:hypothetical protein